MKTPNIPLLRKAVEWVEEQDKLTTNREWFQGEWLVDADALVDPDSAFRWDVKRLAEPLHQRANWCDTAYCLAGKIALDAGWTPVFDHDYDDGTSSEVELEGEKAYVDEVAARLLGITDDKQAAELFSGANTAADIRRIAEEIAGEPL